MRRLEFFFDCSSPWTYLAFARIEKVAAMIAATIEWRPILIGGIFNQVNPSVYYNRENPVPEKIAYMHKDLRDWCELQGLEINWPELFPVSSVAAMRGALYAQDQNMLPAYARKVFEAYWRDGADIANPQILAALAGKCGLNQEAFLTALKEQAIKDRLRENTQELADRGGFGSPTIFIDRDDMYFGNDRLDLIMAKYRAG